LKKNGKERRAKKNPVSYGPIKAAGTTSYSTREKRKNIKKGRGRCYQGNNLSNVTGDPRKKVCVGGKQTGRRRVRCIEGERALEMA